MERIMAGRRVAAIGCTLCVVLSVAGIVVLGWPSMVTAQSAHAAAVFSDTTIQPGHLDFSRYDVPSRCVQAVQLATAVAQRTELDTGIYAPERDTLPTVAAEVARRCGEHFTAASVAPRELLSLVQLALAAKRDTVAYAAATRWTNSIADPNERAWAMYALVRAFTNAHPSRYVDAERIVARMDSMGKAGAAPRINAHGVLLQDAERRFDVPRLEREVFATLKANGLLVGEEENDVEFGSGNAIYVLLWAELYRDPAHAVNNVMRLAHDAGYHWPSDTAEVRKNLSTITMPISHVPPPIVAKYWYGPHGTDTWSVPGKVTLLFAEPEPGDYAHYALIRRLHQKYGDALNMMVVTKTVGYLHDSGPLEPAQEADSLRSYYFDYLKLPVTLAVEETPFHHLPDGRRVNEPTSTSDVGLYGYSPILVNQSGQVIIFGEGTETPLEAFIDQALKR